MSYKKTGDIKGNTESLIRNLKLVKYPDPSSYKVLSSGKPEIYLPIIHYSLFNYSSLVAKFLSDNHYDMYAKNDLDFIETAFKCLLNLFNYKPEINTNQFFSNGFAEGKIILCKEIIDLVLQKDNELSRKNKSYNSNKQYSFNETTKSNIYKTDNNNSNPSPRFCESNLQNNNRIICESEINNNDLNENNNINDISNNINSFNASLPMKSIPVPTPKPQYLTKNNNFNNNNYYGNNIQSSVQSFKPKNNTVGQIEVYDSSQDFPPVYDSSNPSNSQMINNNSYSRKNNNSFMSTSNSTNLDFNAIVKVITSLSDSVNQMVGKIEKFKDNIEERMNKVEAEIVLIKNKQNYLDTKLSSGVNINNNNINEQLSGSNSNNYLKNNNINNSSINNNIDYAEFSNSVTQKASTPKENKINFGSNNQVFRSFAPDKNNLKDNNIQEMENSNFIGSANKNFSGHEGDVYNVFAYGGKMNERGVNDVDNNEYKYEGNIESNDLNNKYADIDKLIQNSEKRFLETQKLLEHYGNTDLSKNNYGDNNSDNVM